MNQPNPALSPSRSRRRAGLSRHRAAVPPPPARHTPSTLYRGLCADLGEPHDVVACSRIDQGREAEHGDWKIKVTGIPKNTQVHAYVARSDPNMGVRTGAKRSYFVDQNGKMTRSSEASCIYADGEFDTTGH